MGSRVGSHPGPGVGDPRALRGAITKVVVPLDGSQLGASAIGPAGDLAEATGATLRLLTAEPLVLWRERVQEATAYLEQQAAGTGLPGIETLVVEDHAAHQAILHESRTEGTVVCMAAHGRGGLGYAALGSVAEAVLHDSHHPILLVGPELASPPQQLRQGDVVVAVDGSRGSEAILPVVADWAHMLELRPWVVEVLPAATGNVDDSRKPPHESSTVRGVAQRLRDDGVSAEWEVLHESDTADALLNFASQLPAALIAMGTHGRTGLARAALGSVTMNVVHGSACPVLVARMPKLAA
jgi:nucleotide-binding universal stress UspA family protein